MGYVFDKKQIMNPLPNSVFENIQANNKGCIIIWLNYDRAQKKYEYIIQYNQYKKYCLGEKTFISEYEAYVNGVIDAVNRITKSKKICFVYSSIVNINLEESLKEAIRDKGCTYHEICGPVYTVTDPINNMESEENISSECSTTSYITTSYITRAQKYKLFAVIVIIGLTLLFITKDVNNKHNSNTNGSRNITQNTSLEQCNKEASDGKNDKVYKENIVWVTATGSCYHRNAHCGNSQTSRKVTKDEAIEEGYRRCSKCW